MSSYALSLNIFLCICGGYASRMHVHICVGIHVPMFVWQSQVDMTCLSQSHIYLPCWGQVSNLCTELTSQIVKLASSFWGSPDPA